LSDCIPASSPWWAQWGGLARISRRARWESCRRAWRNLTPPATSDGEDGDKEVDAENAARRQRRAILSLLRTLSQPAEANGFDNRKVPAIRQIERRAARESNKGRSSSRGRRNLVAERRPKDLETPRYTVLYSAKSGLEIRQYEPYRVCTYDMMGPNGSGGGRSYNPATDAATSEPAKGNVQAFGALAGYLFGKNQEKLAMKMTTPVFMNTNDNSNENENNAGGTTKSMSFVLPSDYWGDGDDGAPPQPLAESGVRIETVATGTTRAVWPFGGYARRSPTNYGDNSGPPRPGGRSHQPRPSNWPNTMIRLHRRGDG
jgi:SOUL heme-binding protein